MSAAPPSPAGKPWMFLTAAIVVGGLGAFGAVHLLGGKHPPSPVLAAAPLVVEPQPTVEAPKPVVEAPKPVVEAPKPVDAHPRVGKPRPAEVVPADAAALLDQADAALAAKDVAGAITFARRSMQHGPTSRAYALLTRAHCRTGDLTNARATWIHVAAGDRPRVHKECSSNGTDL